MWVHAQADGTPVERWLKSYDLENFGPDGYQGVFAFTDNPREAMTFLDVRAVMAAWKMPSVTRPTRIDGKPNRPLTLFTISPQRLP